MRKISFLMVVLLSLSVTSQAQFWKLRRFELGGGLGTTQLYGDIGGFSRGKNLLGLKDFSFKQMSFNANASGRYRITSDFTARLNLAYGGFHSTDARGSNESRGYESKTRFFEGAAIGEFYFLRNRAEGSFLAQKGRRFPFNSFLSMLDCYAFTGFGMVSYNVKPNEMLQPKTTNPKGVSPVIPIGAGVNFSYSPDLNFGVELGGRYVFSDNLDGYTSQYSEGNDIYYFFNVSAIYKIKTRNRSRSF